MGILFSKTPDTENQAIVEQSKPTQPVVAEQSETTEPVLETIAETTVAPPTTTEPVVANVTETSLVTENLVDQTDISKGTKVEVAPVDVNPAADVIKKSKNKKKSNGKH